MKLLLLIVVLCVLGTKASESKQPENFIINGIAAPPTPYHAYVSYINEANAGFFGGGTLISSRHILTAGQCIVGFVRWYVGLGSNMYNALQMQTTTTAIAHPLYNVVTRDNDIGIITLVSDVVFSAAIAPIALFSTNDLMPLENEQGVVVGFGHSFQNSNQPSSTLQQAYKRVLSNARCSLVFLFTIPNHFCAMDETQFSNICNGDIGGAFVTSYRGQLFATGINSFIIEGCGSTWPSAYTRISVYRDWIRQVTQV